MKEIIWTSGAGREMQEVYEQLEDVRDESGDFLRHLVGCITR